LAAFREVCRKAPEKKELCNPAVILKCTVEAMRAMTEVELGEMQYGLIMKNLAPITGDIKPQDLAAITSLTATGIQGEVPYSVPTQAQINEAKLPQAAVAVAEALVQAGADRTTVDSGLKSLGVTETQTMSYTSTTTAASPPPPTVGQGTQEPETPASAAQ
jgi:hypothetical protein